MIYFEGLLEATFEPATTPRVREQRGNREITPEALLVGVIVSR